MAYTLQQLPGEPIIIDAHMEPLDPNAYAVFAKDLVALATSIEGTIWRIIDLSGVSLSFTLLVHVMAEEAKSGLPGTSGDPRVRPLLVGSGEAIDLMVKGAQNQHYGSIEMQAFATQEEAIAYARAQIAAEKMPEA